MKRKILNILVALALVLGMSLVMAAPAAATATAVSAVTVVPNTTLLAATASKYTITMTTATTLVADTDTISIVFPSAYTVPTTITDAADVTINTVALDATTKYVVSGQRVQLEVPGAVTAGTVTVVIGVTANRITNPVAGSYQLTVYTSKDTTAVLSTAFIIGGSADSQLAVASVALSPYTVGVASQYTVTITTQTATLAANVDTITITFPAGTTVPASISSAAYVTIGGVALDSTSDYVGNATTRVVTLTVPADNTAGSIAVVFLVGAGIINPTLVSTPTLTAHTSQEPIESATRAYASVLLAGAITKAVFTDLPTAAVYNTATTITLQTQDLYGNAKATTGAITFILTTTNTATGVFGAATVVLTGASSGTFTYLDTVSGATLTAYESPTQSWTDATGTFTINLQVALYHGATLVANFNTIQAAITAAVGGDTIQVAAGTYTEQPLIPAGKDGLVLAGAGYATTIIQHSTAASPKYGISVASKSVTISGFSIKGFLPGETVVLGGGGDESGIMWNGGGTTTAHMVIDSNLIEGFIDGVSGSGGPTYCDVTNNTFNNNGTGVFFNTADYILVSGNTFTNYAAGIGGTDGTDGSRIESNTFSGNNGSIATAVSTVITSNGGSEAIGVGDLTASTSLVIIKNTITGINTYGIHVWTASGGTNVVIKYNDITVTATAGVKNESTGDLNVQQNWWGTITGPLVTATNPSGTGPALSLQTGDTYSPWLYNAQATVVASGKSQYATSVLLSNVATLSGSTYSGGWNTFSTPISLDSSADTWSEIKTLAGVSARVASAYAWNGITWATPTDITPLNAIFVQLTPGDSISLPILYGTTLMPAATKTMHAAAGSYTGWELIGPASLTNDDFDGVALVSINTKYSQVINPITGAVLSGANTMAVGAGYWVFMTADGTLAGFSVTPVPFVAVP